MTTKRFFILITGLVWILQAGGQTTFKPEFSAGPSFGMGISSVSFVPKVQENQLMGVHTGLTVRWLTETFAGLVLEINYSQEGWDEHFDNSAFHYTRRLNYIDIPFLAHFYYAVSKRVHLFLNVGPKVGYLLSESTSGYIDIVSPPIDEITGKSHSSEQWDKPVENKFAWGICGGPGLELRTGIGCFQLEGRYYYSLGDIFDNRKADYFSKSSTQLIFGKLTYLIPLK
jgi:hypothetical protein